MVQPYNDVNAWPAVLVTAASSAVTLYFLARRFHTEFAFQWFYIFGVICLGIATSEVLREIGASRIIDWNPPFGTSDLRFYDVLTGTLFALTTMIVGLAFIATALVHDFLHARSPRPPRHS
jgi:hypothetical protein